MNLIGRFIGVPISENRYIVWLDWSKRAHRGLRTWILYLLQSGPKNGAEIMGAMESMSQGWWRPSAGSVYPMLELMTEEGLIKKMEDGKYDLTPQGRVEIDWPYHMKHEPRSVEEVVKQINSYVSYLEDISATDKVRVAEQAQKLKELSTRLAKAAGA